MLLRKIFIFIFISIQAFSQSDIENLKEPIKLYTLPFINGTIGNLNSGWMQKSPNIKMMGLDVEIGFTGMGTLIGEDERRFQTTSNVKLNEQTIDLMIVNVPENLKPAAKEQLKNYYFNVTVSGPTIVGSSSESVKLFYPGDTVTINYQGENYDIALQPVSEDSKITGSNFPVVPMAALHFSIGTVAGTRLMFRLVPPVSTGSSFSDIYYIGGGIQHNPMVWFTKKPVINTSVSVMMYKMRAGDVFNSFGAQWGVSVSRSFGPKLIQITPFIGVGLEYSKTHIEYSYNYTDNSGNAKNFSLNFDLPGETSMRINTGLELRAAVVNLSLCYSYSKYHSLSAGLGIIF